ncbi:RHS repeat-associated core domain-containing protein [Serratia microhaemolytica]|uniref:RHS repeat-associated core domain-containing protein n=1 Tax=Serratia microhaemolytica TaxID=2675110 RepID=UPI000FDD354A|nr:RHS repeat-associated core domain-containing protein [Serratia microhaemolytica]
MLPAAKHFDPVVGVDVHMVNAPTPTPIPHPHVGFILDLRELSEGFKAAAKSIAQYLVMDAVQDEVAKLAEENPELAEKAMSAISAGGEAVNKVLENPLVKTGMEIQERVGQAQALLDTITGQGGGGGGPGGRPILINGIMRATAGTHTFHIPGLHFPLGAGFAPADPKPSQDSESFMGSKTVLANNDPLSFSALPAMSCWMTGLRSIGHNSAHTKRKHDSLPTSVMLPIPVGRPVLVGGAPTMNTAASPISLFKAFRGSGLAKWLARKLNLKSGFLKCVVLDAEPVHTITGEVIVEQNDFTLSGRLPLVWDRYYAGQSRYNGVLGHGWQCPADIRLQLIRYDGLVGVAAYFPDHETAFDLMPQQLGWAARQHDWQQGHALYRQDNQLVLRTRHSLEYRFTLPDAWEQAVIALPEGGGLALPIAEFSDLNGNGWQFLRRANGTLARIEETRQQQPTGRAIICASERGYLTEMQWEFGLAEGEAPQRSALRRYQQDHHGDLVAVFDEVNRPYGFGYEAGHRMVRHTDRNGLSFYYSYQSHPDGIMRVDHAWGDGGLFDYRFVYDLAHRETLITDSLGHTSIMQYDDRQLPIAKIDPLGGIYSYQYDSQDRACAEIDPLGNVTRWEYDAQGNLLSEIQPDNSTLRTHYDEHHNPSQFVDPEGLVWQQQWDEKGNLVSQITPSGMETRYQYDEAGQLVSAGVSGEQPTTLSYDHWGYLATLTNSQGETSRFEHDRYGRLQRKITPDGGQTHYHYDARHRLIRCTLPDHSTLSYQYDEENNLLYYIENDQRVTAFSYFGQGQLQSRTEPDGRRVEYRYDTEQQLIGVQNPRGEWWQLKRDPLGRLIEEIDYQGQARYYHYNLAGHLQASTDPLGNPLTVRCDPLGRITEKRDAQGGCDRYRYNRRGQLTEASNAHAVITRAYNPSGALTQETQTQPNLLAELHYEYDTQGRLVSQRQRMQHRQHQGVELHNEQHFRYDAAGFLIEQQIDQQAPIRSSYDCMGRLAEQQLSEHLTQRFSYSLRGQLQQQHSEWKGKADGSIRYHYDAYGNLVCREDSRLGKDHYRYDLVGQILAHIDPAGEMREYRYDACGDRFQVLENDQHGRTLQHEDGIRSYQDRAGKTRWRQQGQQRLEFDWDGQERLSSLNNGQHRWHYHYDPFGRRIAKIQSPLEGDQILSETYFIWDGDVLVGELSSPVALQPSHAQYCQQQAANDEIDRIIIGAEPAAWRRAAEARQGLNGRFYSYQLGSFEPLTLQDYQLTFSGEIEQQQIYYYQNDANGMPLRLRDSAGEVVWLARYSSFGKVERIGYNQIVQPLRLQGQYYDSESALHYNRHRYYDPDCGMFINQDPIGLAGGLNPYQFAPNTLMWVDPLGLESCATGRDSYEQARNKALKWLEERGFKAERVNTGKFGATKGQPVGMTTADGKTGFRIEYDERSGAHINVFSGKEKGEHFLFDAPESVVTELQKLFDLPSKPRRGS